MGKKEIVVYTSGTFDLFHVGHLNVLKQSRAIGDKLIVGVSTDELVATYKQSKPIVPYESRAEIIRNQIGVDSGVKQEELTPVRILKQYDVDICMLRKDYDKFVTQGQALMSNKFHSLTHKSGQNFPCSSCKVDKKGTECVTADTLDPQKSRRYGIGKLLTVRRVCRLITKVYTKNKNSHLVYVCLSGVTHKANRIPLDVFKSYTTMSFEGYQFPVIKDYKTYLTAKYGDYMELPPEDQRIAHGIIDVKFGKNPNPVRTVIKKQEAS